MTITNRQQLTTSNQQSAVMPNLLTIPNEILDQIASYLDPVGTSHLLLSCRSLASLLMPAMRLHAEAPKDNEYALHWASRKGHLPLIQYLLTRFPVDLEKDDRSTPLQAASWSCTNTLAVEYLLLRGAAINHTNCFGLTALYYACQGETANEDIAEPLVRLLIAHGANVHNEPHAPLTIAVGAGFARVSRLLLDAGASPNVRIVNGEPVVVSAARQAGTVEILELLLDHGADINAVDSEGRSALLIAAKYGPLGTVQMLVARGSNLTSQDNAGNTPLLLAVMNGQRDIAEYLVGLDGADVQSGNRAGDLPIYRAVWMGYDVVPQSLRSRGDRQAQ